MSRKEINYLIIAVLFVVLVFAIYKIYSQNKIEKIAECLTNKQVVMYGALWCPHCAQQRELFGKAFEKITYINCQDKQDDPMAEVCINKNITKFPTWFMSDATRIEGIYKPETLKTFAGCSL